MLEGSKAVQAEYPKALISKCRMSRNQIYRKRTPKGMCRAVTATAEVEPTLLELDQPEPYKFYDIFEINDFSYSGERKKGHFKAELSLLNSCESLEIYAHILDIKNGRVIKEVTVQHAENANHLVLEQEFSIDGELAENMGVIAYGKWGHSGREENELTAYKEVNTSYPGVKYMHKYPKKEKEAVTFGTLERMPPDPGAKGDGDHIVIALIRSPEDKKDIDYICGAGRDHKKGHPIVCVPGEGAFRFPAGETPKNSAEFPNHAICKLYRKSGGAAVIARSDYAAYSTNAITITPSGSLYIYQFLAWGMGYDDPASWKKTEFDYCLELTLNTVRDDGTWNTREFCIDTRNPGASITDEVLALEIMYGCMAPDTQIAMSDGSCKQICQIQIGDVVKGKNGEEMQVENIWKGPEQDRMLEIRAEGLRQGLFLTKNHPVWIREPDGATKWKRAGLCSVGDRVLIWDLQGKEIYYPIIEVEEKEPCEEVYNLDLRPLKGGDMGTMYCNGILTGDNRLQNSDLEG